MFNKKRVVFRTSAGVDDARRLLQAQTLTGSPKADNLVGTLKDTLSADKTPFRGELAGTQFRLTRRVRGQRMRVQLVGELEGKPGGGTEIRASMTPPASVVAGLIGGMLAVLIVMGTLAVGGAPLWLPGLLLLSQGVALAVGARTYDAEVSRTFAALRDAIPENPLPAIAEPVASPEQAPEGAPRVSIT